MLNGTKKKKYVLDVLASGKAFVRIQLIDQDYCAYHRDVIFFPTSEARIIRIQNSVNNIRND